MSEKQTVLCFSHLLDVGRQACVDDCLRVELVLQCVHSMVETQVHQEPLHFHCQIEMLRDKELKAPGLLTHLVREPDKGSSPVDNDHLHCGKTLQ